MKTTRVRLSAVSGMFYPEDAEELREQVDAFISEAKQADAGRDVRAMIAPHAGYIYSGPIAGSAYAHLSRAERSFTRVVIMSPSHRVGFSGIACSNASSFQTPLGDVPLDHEAAALLQHLPWVIHYDAAHEREHGIEVHLPFLQRTLTDFSIVPLVVGNAAPEEVSSVLQLVWSDDSTLVVISSDLSHYLSYDRAVQEDTITTRAIEQLNPAAIDADHACGWLPVRGLLLEAGNRGLRAATLDQRNSGDTAGDKRQVVGYGAYVFN